MHFFCLNKSKIITAVFVATFLLIVGVVVLLYVFKPYPLYYTEEISYASEKYGVSSSLIASVIFTESSFNPEAKSNRGAVGLMQILPSTAKWIAEELNEDYFEESLFDSKTNIRYGCFYLNYLFDKFKRMDIVICAYNAGEGKVFDWIEDGYLNRDKIDYKETKVYLNRVENFYNVYKNKLVNI